nr:reverse transcriptase domain-containing protein [Tanacetum cinerariifolium]
LCSLGVSTWVLTVTPAERRRLAVVPFAAESLGHASDAALQEYCDKNYHQHLPIIAEKVHQEKVQQERLKAVKARLNFEETSQHSESGTPSRRRYLKKRLGPRHARSMSRSPEPRHGHSESPRKRDPERKTVFKRLKKGVFHRLGDKGKTLLESGGSAGEHWKSKPKRQKSSVEDDLSQPWVAASNRERKKSFPSWKQQEAGQKPSFKKGGFRNQQRPERKQDRFTLLTKTPKKILDLDKGKFKPPPPMTTPRQIKEMLKAEKLSHLIKELKSSSGKDQAKAAKKEETSGRKEKPLAILMVQSWQRVAKQNITQTFSTDTVISFSPLGEEDGTEGPMIIEAEIGGHFVHRMLRGRRLLFKNLIGDEEHSTSAWMNFMVVTSLSPYNGIIERPGVRRIQAVPSTAHEMLKFLVADGTVTLQSKEGQKDLCGLLRRNLDIFTWKPADMTGVLRQIAEHRLNIRDGRLPVRQKKRGEAPERNKAIYEEVKKLVDAGIMEEVYCHSWMPNPIMVKKHDVNADGLKICPEKVEAVLGLSSPKCLKDVQKLNGKLASLNGFLSKSAEKSLPFFKTLKKYTRKSDFQWTVKAEIEFKQMKKSIAELPMLTASKEKEELIIYLAAKKEDVSAVLMTEKDGKQMPIYFVSRTLQGPKINYTPMEKLILALVSASKRLKRYFQAHTIIVIMDHPIKQIPSNPKVTGRLLKWSFELEEHDIHYRPRTHGEEEPLSDPWIMFTDGSSCIDVSGAGLIIKNPEGMKFTYALRFRKVLIKYLEKVKALTSTFKEFFIKQVPKGENKKADALSKIASTSFAHLSKQVLVEELKEKLIDEKEVLAVVEEEGRTWMTHIHEYLVEEILAKKSKGYTPQGKKVRGGKSPKIRVLLANYARRCQKTNKGIQRLPGPGKVKFLIVAIDYFTKWIEAKPMATIMGDQIKKFVWENIVCRFGFLGEIISNNEKQLKDNPFKNWCEKQCIHQCFASVKHPQANGLVERANRSLGEGIKAMLDERSNKWLEEISNVLWAHRTMIMSSNGETPLSLTYGTEAVIPVEIGMPTLRTAEVDMIKNNEDLGINLDLLEEKREHATIQEAKSKVKMEKYYNTSVLNISFRPGDFVYRNNEASHAKEGGKLGPKWEGPYEVMKALGRGAYKLRGSNRSILPGT